MNWKSFTEFFEGEGAVSVRLGRAKNPSSTLQVCVVIGQKWKPKLEQVEGFLRSRGIVCSKIYKQKYRYSLRVFRILAVQDILTNILPFSFLKREQIRAALRYLKGEIAGDDLIATFNQEFDLGKRRIRPPMVSVPLRRLDAAKKARKEAFQRMHSLD